jgi:DNA-binding transcriptional LysR family regulator
MDVRQLRYVLAVVDHGTFTAAARACGLSQPSLSQAVRSLEAELGAELFRRGARSVTLTSAGEALVGPARQAVRDLATAEAAVAEVVGVRSGRLDLVCLPTLAASPAAALIGRFRRAAPEVTVRLHETDVEGDVVGHVLDGASEVALAELPVAADLMTHELVTHELDPQDYVVVLPPDADDGPLPRRRMPLTSLAGLPIITTPPGTSTRRQIDGAFAAVGLEPHVVVETDHREAIGPLVIAGAGVSLLPRAAAQAAEQLGAIIREVRPPLVRRIGLVTRPGPVSPAARLVADRRWLWYRARSASVSTKGSAMSQLEQLSQLVGDGHRLGRADRRPAGVALRVAARQGAGTGDEAANQLAADLVDVAGVPRQAQHRQVHPHMGQRPRLGQHVGVLQSFPRRADVSLSARGSCVAEVGLQPSCDRVRHSAAHGRLRSCSQPTAGGSARSTSWRSTSANRGSAKS